MSLTPRQLRAIRRRREHADADAEARFQQDVVGPLMGFADDALPPSVQVGWREPQPLGGRIYCLVCSPQPPTSTHVPVFVESHIATHLCLCCGRRLDYSI